MGKKYSVNMEKNKVVSFEVDGVSYAHLDDIPDEADRKYFRKMLYKDSHKEHQAQVEAEQEAKAEAMRQEMLNSKWPLWVMGIFLLVALIALTMGVLTTIGAIRTIRSQLSTPGKVVELVVHPYRDPDTWRVTNYSYPIVEFTTLEGKPMSVELSEGSYPPSYVAGDEVTILYDAHNPERATIKSITNTALQWLAPVIGLFVGLVFLGAIAVTYKVTMG